MLSPFEVHGATVLYPGPYAKVKPEKTGKALREVFEALRTMEMEVHLSAEQALEEKISEMGYESRNHLRKEKAADTSA